MIRPPRPTARWVARAAMAGIICLTLGIAIGGWRGGVLTIVGLGFLLFCCRDPREGFLLAGPFLRVELRRSARGSRRHFWRPIYVLVTFTLLFTIIQNRFFSLGEFTDSLNSSRAKQLAASIEQFFGLYSICALIYVMTLTINVCASVVAEERESKRWDILRTSDLRPREILFGKLFGRMPQLLDPVVTTLPVLMLCTFLGGVSPVMIVLVVLGVFAGIVAIGGVTLFYSCFATTPETARSMTIALLAFYLFISSAIWALSLVPPVWTFPNSLGYRLPVEVGDVVPWIASGNPIAIYLRAVNSGSGFEAALAESVRHFGAFAALVGLSFALVGARRLPYAKAWLEPATRTALQTALKADGVTRFVIRGSFLHRPRVMDQSIEWWERYGHLTSTQMKFTNWMTIHRTVRMVFFLIVILLILTALLRNIDPKGPERLRVAVGITAFAFCWPVILGAILKGARSIARERAGGTLDGLRTTSLTTWEILVQKWRGVILAELPAIRIGSAVLMAGIVTGLIDAFGGLMFGLATAVYAVAGAALGIAFSVNAPSPLHALRLLAISVVPFTILCTVMAVTPLCAGIWLIVDQQQSYARNETLNLATYGLLLWTVIGTVAWGVAIKQFERLRSA